MRASFSRVAFCMVLSLSVFASATAFSAEMFTYVVPPIYDQAFDFSDNMARVKSGDVFYFIDPAGGKAISQDFKGLTKMSEGLAGATVDNVKWGVIDKQGKFVVEPKFGRIAADGFSSGLAAFLQGAKWGYADTKGNIVIEPQFQQAGSFKDDLAPVNASGSFLYIDKKGLPAIASKDRYEYASNFKDGVAVVLSNRNVFFIDRAGKVLLQKPGLGGFPFENGLAPLMADFDACGFIDSTGKIVIAAKYPMVWPFSEGLAAFKDATTGLWGYLDTKGAVVIPPTFETAYSFMKVSDGKLLAAVKESNKKWGFITPVK